MSYFCIRVLQTLLDSQLSCLCSDAPSCGFCVPVCCKPTQGSTNNNFIFSHASLHLNFTLHYVTIWQYIHVKPLHSHKSIRSHSADTFHFLNWWNMHLYLFYICICGDNWFTSIQKYLKCLGWKGLCGSIGIYPIDNALMVLSYIFNLYFIDLI